MNQLSDPIFSTESAFMPQQLNSWYLRLFKDQLYPIFACIQPISSQSATIGAINYNLWVRLRPGTWTTGYLREKFQKGLHVSLLQWIPDLRNVNLFVSNCKKKHQKPSKNPQGEATFKSFKVSLCPSLWTPGVVQSHWPFQPAPHCCGRALLHAAANDAGAGSHAHRPGWMWSCGLKSWALDGKKISDSEFCMSCVR